jgi:hypothetical protein
MLPTTATRAGRVSGGTGKDTLSDALAALKHKSEAHEVTSYKKQNHKLCTEAIEAFQSHEWKLALGKVKFKAPNLQSKKLSISGVSVSVSFDVMTEKTNAKGVKSVGGIVLVFPKRADMTGTSSSDARPLQCSRMKWWSPMWRQAKSQNSDLVAVDAVTCELFSAPIPC